MTTLKNLKKKYSRIEGNLLIQEFLTFKVTQNRETKVVEVYFEEELLQRGFLKKKDISFLIWKQILFDFQNLSSVNILTKERHQIFYNTAEDSTEFILLALNYCCPRIKWEQTDKAYHLNFLDMQCGFYFRYPYYNWASYRIKEHINIYWDRPEEIYQEPLRNGSSLNVSLALQQMFSVLTGRVVRVLRALEFADL